MDEETEDFTENTDSKTNENEAKSAISADLIRGHINTIILRTLYERDKYGYEIIEEIEKKSHGQYTLKQPTLYSALKRLETQGFINAYWKTDEVSLGGRRKYYTLTDSGREVTEKNQAEWEYSRTVIDNLISDRSFDFTQPPPAAVDFKILKQSTSRIRTVKDDNDEYDEDVENENEFEDRPEEIEIEEPVNTESESVPVPIPASETVKQAEAIQDEPMVYAETHEENIEMDEEQKRIVHENYLKLISDPTPSPAIENIDEVPVAEEIDTDKLIYNNKPETERDYRNLINNLFIKTVSQPPKRETDEDSYTVATSKKFKERTEPPATTVKIDDMGAKAEAEGLKINTSEYVITDNRKKGYNRGGSLFKSSLIIAIILLLEFVLCLLFKNDLGVGIAYPFVLLALAAAQLLIFGVLYYTDLGKNSRKPTSAFYLSVCIILSVIVIFVVFIVSLLLGVNFSSAGDIMAKLVIPSVVALNIPAFALCFYFFSK